MEELDLKQLLNIFWNKKLQIILIIAIFIAIGIIYTYGFTTPVYTSSTSLVLAGSNTANGNNQTSETITTTDLTLNSKLVSTYSELVKRKNVIRQVISNLGINVNENTIRNNITVNSVKNTELIEISVTNENPIYAAQIANETAKVFTEEIAGKIYNINNVHVIDEAEVSKTPSNINHQKDIVIFAFIGVVVSIIYVLIANMLGTTVKTAEEIEKTFKIPVLASVPICGTDMQKKKGRKKKRKKN